MTRKISVALPGVSGKMWDELLKDYGYSTGSELLRDMLRRHYKFKTGKEVPDSTTLSREFRKRTYESPPAGADDE